MIATASVRASRAVTTGSAASHGASLDLTLPRAKPRHPWLGLRYRLYRLSRRFLPARWLLRRWLNAAWLSRRIAQELTGQVFGEEVTATGGALSADLLLASIEPGARVVDIGCGTGAWVRTAARKAASVVGVDHDPAVIEEARRLGAPANAQFQVADARTVAGGEGFDLGLLIHVLEHLERPVEFLRDLRKVCRRLLVEVPDFENDPLNRVRHHLGLPYFYDVDHVREYTEASLAGELERAGWSVRVLRKRHLAILVEAT